ncbi:MAG: cytochrome c [Myxococcota bacterium]
MTVRCVSLAFGFMLVGCGQREDVREWTPADHHNQKNNAGQVSGSATPGQEGATLAQVTYQQRCATCHGPRGRGDGPQGRMLKVPSLARASMGTMPAEAIVATIRNGRGKMPPFRDLPDQVVRDLVTLIRGFSAR